MRTGDAGELGRNRIPSQAYPAEYASAKDRAGQSLAGQEEKNETGQGVKLSLSESIQEMLEKQFRESQEAEKENGEKLGEYGKILEIARRIARGDKVPPRDEKKLMEYSAELYQMAKSAAMLNAMKKHKKHKSLFEDEENSMTEKLRELEKESRGAESAGGAAEGAETGGEAADGESES